MTNELKKYIQSMAEKRITEWPIGWESLPKYIGAKIQNTRTGITAILKWGKWPELFDESGNEVQFTTDQFRHGTGEWIYKVVPNE